jgi:hypothetical protein
MWGQDDRSSNYLRKKPELYTGAKSPSLKSGMVVHICYSGSTNKRIMNSRPGRAK